MVEEDDVEVEEAVRKDFSQAAEEVAGLLSAVGSGQLALMVAVNSSPSSLLLVRQES